ncbi:MAG: hypothetical protein LUH58_10235, partial [Lachnospiraceae bacterium]|nr:hypothetical protein [Lachnospiraceae bacterium]
VKKYEKMLPDPEFKEKNREKTCKFNLPKDWNSVKINQPEFFYRVDSADFLRFSGDLSGWRQLIIVERG